MTRFMTKGKGTGRKVIPLRSTFPKCIAVSLDEYAEGPKTTRDEQGRLHSFNDMPAFVGEDGTEEYYHHGMRHRAGDRPAIITPEGHKVWCMNDDIHRDGDRPAMVYADGTKLYYKKGRQYTP